MGREVQTKQLRGAHLSQGDNKHNPTIHENKSGATPAFLWTSRNWENQHNLGLCQDTLLQKGIQVHGSGTQRIRRQGD